MSLEQKYPVLFQFFAGYFPEADLDGLTDPEVVAEFKKLNPPEVIQETVTELANITNDSPWLGEISKEANRYFATNEAAWEWVKMIKAELTKE